MVSKKRINNMYRIMIQNLRVSNDSSKMDKQKRMYKLRQCSSMPSNSSVPFIHSVYILLLIVQLFSTSPCLGFFNPPIDSIFIKSFRPVSSEDESNLFVFPSMHMDQISLNDHPAPLIEVKYHGKSPIPKSNADSVSLVTPTSGMMASASTTTRALRSNPLPGSWSYNSLGSHQYSTTRPPTQLHMTTGHWSHDTTWNPDAVDHSVNPNKSRRPQGRLSTTTEIAPLSSSSYGPQSTTTSPRFSSRRSLNIEPTKLQFET